MYEQYSCNDFEEANTYTGSDLGASWLPQETVFRVWAPTAGNVEICFYPTGDPLDTAVLWKKPMEPDVQGTWIAVQAGDIRGIYYTYQVTVDGKTVEACDPYARAAGVNGRRAMVVDLESTDPAGWSEDVDPHFGGRLTDAVIYELHVRDLSAQRGAGFRHRGKFLALTETGLVTKGGEPVGIDHIRSLGVTHIHLLPIFDFGRVDESRSAAQYNWGYDPVNFNVPDGSYATDSRDGAVRIRELKQTVKFLHDHGLSVIMDVVYNHVFDAGQFCFNRIVPGYFSRGGGSNGSGCGNDTASERSMVRKYIVDSVCFWADEYHIDGFRFDLVGLLDVQTVHQIMAAVHEKHPNVLFYGEGWTMPTKLSRPDIPLAVQSNSHLLPGFAFFNDTIRDLLRGTVFDRAAPGFVCGAGCDRAILDACFTGTPFWAAQPEQCVNYVSCHDNTTLFDRIALAASEAPFETRVCMNHLAAAFCILSQGVPFFLAGEEMLRTKPGRHGGFDENSFRSPDKVNCLKWDTLDRPAYAQTAAYYKGLIAFRKAHSALRLTTREDVGKQVHPIPHADPHVAVYRVEEQAQELFFIFNANTQSMEVPLPEGGSWDIYIQGAQAGLRSLGQVSGTATVQPISALVLARKRMVDVVAALLWEKDKFLICQRPASKARGLLWEFVGGKVEPGESREAALVRECREELDVTVQVGREFMTVIHDYPDILIRLTLFHCILDTGRPTLLEHAACAWIHPSQTDAYDFCPADADILKAIKETYGKNPPL